jgi:Protein of unknown function (DUF3443)
VLVSTATTGLRVLASALVGVAPLPTEADPAKAGNILAECVQLNGGTAWGAVVTADVEVGGETASSVPIQVLSTLPGAAPNCSGTDLSTPETLLANGVLGVGVIAQDCSGASCTSQYYTCPSAGCPATPANVSAAPPVTAQVTNPVTKFAKDNNGIIVELPSVPDGGAPGLTGQIVFGIGTEANNAYTGTSVILPADTTTGAVTTSYTSQQAGAKPVTYTNSWLDTGSFAFVFPDAGIPVCAQSGESNLYCPAQLLNLQATVSSPTVPADTTMVTFSVDNPANVLAGNVAVATLGGPVPANLAGLKPFIFGVAFFFGQNTYLAYSGASITSGANMLKGPFYSY